MRRWAAPLALGLLMASAVVLAAPREQEAPDDLGERAEEALGSIGSTEAPLASGALAAADETSYRSDLTLSGEGERLVGEYRGRGDCVVAQAGYLDLAGSVWGCVMQGEGWVDICVVREDLEGSGCFVVIWHMDADDVGSALGSR